MKRFKKMLSVAAVLVLLAVALLPTTALADSLTDINVGMTDQAPGAEDNFTIDFTTATELSSCWEGSTYIQFNLRFGGPIGLPDEASGVYLLSVDGTPMTWESGGGNPTSLGNYTVIVDNTNKWVYIRYCHVAELLSGTAITIEINNATNPSNTGNYPIWMYTRDPIDVDTDVDTGQWGYLVRLPGEVVATVRGELVSVMVNPGGVNYDVLALGAVKNTALYTDPDNKNGMTYPQTQNIQNIGTVAVDLAIASSNAMYAPGPGTTDWTLAGTITNPEQYTHAYNVGTSVYDGSVPITFTNWADNNYVTVATNVPSGPPGSGATRYLELELGMPTATVDYFPHTIVVTVLATAYSP